jgi:hypothetical protein
MTRYMLSVHTVAGDNREPMSAEDMRHYAERIGTLEDELKQAGAWVFSGRLREPGAAAVVRVSDGDVLKTDGPFAESKEHIGGFYIIEAEGTDAALGWASKVTAAVGAPIEVWPFADFRDA